MIPVSEARDALGLADEQATNTALERMITAVTALLGRELNRYLGKPALATVQRRGGTAILLLDDAATPGDGIDPPVVQGRGVVTDAWSTIAAGDYALDGRALRHVARWPQGVRITYTRGYPVGSGPAELRDLVLAMVVERWTADHAEIVKSESIGDYSYTNYTALELAGASSDWKDMVARWRVPQL